MELEKISLSPLQGRRVAVLGYGNQGRAHALNLRDSGVSVLVGCRPGAGFQAASRDGFSPTSFAEAVGISDIVMFLLPDQVIPSVYGAVTPLLSAGSKTVGFAHGFAYHFGFLELLPSCAYFLVSPKGAGAILRSQFEKGDGLPGVFAIGQGARPETRDLCLAYARAIGVAKTILLETTFQEETECDLFGEQAVLCGGILQLMESAATVLVENGHTPEMAFFECCYEARLILDLWLKYGPAGMASRISPTAFFGGLTRGQRIVREETKAELRAMFREIRSGAFAKEWMAEVDAGMPRLAVEKKRLAESMLEAAFQKLSPQL